MDIQVSTSEERLQRILELKELERIEEEEQEDKKKNKNFTQVYDAGFERMKEFMKDGQGAAGQLYVFLAQHLEPSVGAVAATRGESSERDTSRHATSESLVTRGFQK